jgi:hypothetical protein
MDFIRRLLVKDVNLRMSTADALAHPFITGGLGVGVYPSLPGGGALVAHTVSGGLPPAAAENIVQSMRYFMAADPLVKLILEMVAHTLCPDHIRHLCDEFQALDRTNNGTLTLQAFGTGLLGAPSVANGLVDLSAIFNAIAISKAHGHGQLLTFHEYVAAAMVHRIEIEEGPVQTQHWTDRPF